MMRSQVESSLNLQRDSSSGAIVNTDSDGYRAHIARKTSAINKENELRAEVNELRALILDMKKMLEEK